jgi:hypothetical protein
MSPHDRLGLGLGLFVALFVLAFLGISGNTFRHYFEKLERRKCGFLVKALIGGVFLLAVPYFYDQLVGWHSALLSDSLTLVIAVAATGVLIDVAWFAYHEPRIGSHGRRR